MPDIIAPLNPIKAVKSSTLSSPLITTSSPALAIATPNPPATQIKSPTNGLFPAKTKHYT